MSIATAKSKQNCQKWTYYGVSRIQNSQENGYILILPCDHVHAIGFGQTRFNDHAYLRKIIIFHNENYENLGVEQMETDLIYIISKRN